MPVSTHALTWSATIPGHPDLMSVSTYRTWMYDAPLEREVDGDAPTGLLVGTSTFHPSRNGTDFTEESIHLTGLRYSETGVQHGFLTLDGRAPATLNGGNASNNDSGERPLVFALDDETYLVYRWAGAISYDWRPTTRAWVVRVGANGTPAVIDELTAWAPGGFSVHRGELVFINPSSSWISQKYGTPGSILPAQLHDPAVLGAWGVAVSPAGFGATTRYADPPALNGANTSIAGGFPSPGHSPNGTQVFAWYSHYDPQAGNSSRTILYDVASAAVTQLTVTPAGTTLVGSVLGDKGDVYAGDNRWLSWGWGDDRIATLSGSSVVGEARGYDRTFWDYADFVSDDPDASYGNGLATDRTFFGTEESRWALYTRSETVGPNPPYTSAVDVWDRNPAYQQAFPDREGFTAVVIQYYGSEQAFVDESNQGTVTQVGYWVGFQGASPTPETTYWATWDGTGDIHPVHRLLGRVGSGAEQTFFTAGQVDGSEGTVTVARWDPAVPPAIEYVDDGIRRIFA